MSLEKVVDMLTEKDQKQRPRCALNGILNLFSEKSVAQCQSFLEA